MSTLILRLAAPMQSWGADSKYNFRKTNREPTKSGVLGMLAAALGCARDDTETFARLSGLRFGVRVDREGTMLQDFQTVQGKAKKDNTITKRDYLCDAVFVAGLEGEKTYLEQLEYAVRHPVYPLFLGRRSCPPTGRISLGIVEEDLEQALRNTPWQLPLWRRSRSDRELRMVLDADYSYAQQRDIPISYNPFKREYGYRNIREDWCCPGEPVQTEHDPMAEL